MIGKSTFLKAMVDDYRRATEYFDSKMHWIEGEMALVEKMMADEGTGKKDVYARVDHLLYRAKMLDAEMKAFYTVFDTRSR